MKTVTFKRANTETLLPQRTYIRQRWDDDWVELENAHCGQATWGTGNNVGSAQIRLPSYGFGRRVDDEQTQLHEVAKQSDISQFFVRVSWPADYDQAVPDADPPVTAESYPLDWYGVVDIKNTIPQGAVPFFEEGFGGGWGWDELAAQGHQVAICYGLEAMLQNVRLTTAQQVSRLSRFGEPLYRLPAFNPRGRPNRSLNLTGDAYVFADRIERAEYWSSADIVRYVLAYHAPTDWWGDPLPWFIDDSYFSNLLPLFDRPEFNAYGKSAAWVLNRVMPRGRLFGWTVRVNRFDVANKIEVKPFTFASNWVFLPDGDVIPPGVEHCLDISDDPSAQVSVLEDHMHTCHQVRARGARRRSVFSINNAYDGTLVQGWSAAAEDQLVDVINAADFPAADEPRDRQARLEVAFGQPGVKDVFALFKLPENWDGLAADGRTGGALSKSPVSPHDEFPGESYPLHLPEVRFLSRLPLRRGHDYSEVLFWGHHDDERPDLEIAPFVCAMFDDGVLSGQERWTTLDKAGVSAGLEENESASDSKDSGYQWSATLSIERDHAGLRLNVVGAEQWMLNGSGPGGGADISALFDGNTRPLQQGWTRLIVTVAIEQDVFCEALYPEELIPPADPDEIPGFLKILDISVGDVYRQDYVVPGTVVGIDEHSQELIHSDGGWIRNDKETVEAWAKVAYEWYQTPRRSVRLKSAWIRNLTNSGNFAIGDLIKEVVDLDQTLEVNAVVTSIQINHPLGGDGMTPKPPEISYTTQHGQLDMIAPT